MPEDWKKGSVYAFTYRHDLISDRTITLKCVPMQTILVVHTAIQKQTQVPISFFFFFLILILILNVL